jgi:hypothetical protein
LKNEQRPPRQTSEQHELLLVQTSPSVEHVVDGLEQTLLTHELPQHWTLAVHAPPATTHLFALEQVPVCGSQ